jgi:hypothetical protein
MRSTGIGSDSERETRETLAAIDRDLEVPQRAAPADSCWREFRQEISHRVQEFRRDGAGRPGTAPRRAAEASSSRPGAVTEPPHREAAGARTGGGGGGPRLFSPGPGLTVVRQRVPLALSAKSI